MVLSSNSRSRQRSSLSLTCFIDSEHPSHLRIRCHSKRRRKLFLVIWILVFPVGCDLTPLAWPFT